MTVSAEDRLRILGDVRGVLADFGFPCAEIDWPPDSPPGAMMVPQSDTNRSVPTPEQVHIAFLVAGVAECCLACFRAGAGPCSHPRTPTRAVG